MATPVGAHEGSGVKGLGTNRPTGPGTENQQLTSGGPNSEAHPEQKTAAPSAKGTAADEARSENASIEEYLDQLQQTIEDNESVGRGVSAVLTLDSEHGYKKLTTLAYLRIPEAKRKALALSLLRSVETGQGDLVETAWPNRAGAPLPPWFSVMEEAGWWADEASTAEHKAFALACYQRLSSADQAAFLDYVSGTRRAA